MAHLLAKTALYDAIPISGKRLLLHAQCNNCAFIIVDSAGALRCLSFGGDRDHWSQACSKISPQFVVSVPTSGQLTTQPHAALFNDERRRSRRGQAATALDRLSASSSGGSAGNRNPVQQAIEGPRMRNTQNIVLLAAVCLLFVVAALAYWVS